MLILNNRMLIRLLVNLYWLFWMPVVILSAQPNIDKVFQYLNLDYPGLEKVKKAYQQGNLTEAKKELLSYYQNRTNRKLTEPEKVYPYNKKVVDRNTKNIFIIKSSPYDFGAKIDWTMTREDNQWQFSLARMNWFKNYIGAYQRTKDEKYVLAWMNQIESWLELANPGYPRTIDTGRRLENWVISHWIFVTKLKSPSVTPEFNAKMLLSMAEQAEFLYNPDHWRRYSNWGSFENSGFSKLVIMFPEFKRNVMWLREIYFRMRFQLNESFHSDGMHQEVSPGYHSHELEVWFDFLQLALLNGVKNPWHFQIPLQPLEKLMLPPANTLMYLYKPTGVFPQVSDTDERDERELLLKIGKHWNRADFIYVATDGKEGKIPDKTSVAFPEGGYYIMRSGWGNKDLPFNEELYLLFDCGTNYPWHAHYDILNIVATAYGYDLLKDPGRFTYNEGTAREQFKSTAAHNTIVIDRKDQARRYTPLPARWHSLIGFDYVSGVQTSNSPVIHQRSVFFVKPEYWIVIDRLLGNDSHYYDQYWHLSDKASGKVNITSNGQRVIAPHLVIISLMPQAKMSLEQGWLAYQYRQKVKAPVIHYSLREEPPVVWTTVLFPFKLEVPQLKAELLQVKIVEKNRDSANPVALLISSDRWTDIFFEQQKPGYICSVNKLETDAHLAFVRFDDQNEIIAYQMVEGSYIKYRGKKIAQVMRRQADISVQNDSVEIEGECVSGFQFKVQNKPQVFLNGKKIEVKREKSKISFSSIDGNYN